VVDADQRDVEGCQLTGDGQHRAVAAEHHGHIALLTDLLDRQGRVFRHAGVESGFAFQRHIHPRAGQQMRDILQDRADAAGLVFAHQGSVTETAGRRTRHARNYTTANVSN